MEIKNNGINYNKAEFISSYGVSGQLPDSEIPEIVFSGRSNVGKSSLINKLFNRKSLARVSSSPGKTITVNFYRVEDIAFIDLPGYGYAKAAKNEKKRWDSLVESYFKSGRNIKLVMQLVDIRHPPSKDDLQMIKYLKETGTPFVLVLTKSDKLSKKEKQSRIDSLRSEIPCSDEYITVPFSSITGEGIEELKAIIKGVI